MRELGGEQERPDIFGMLSRKDAVLVYKWKCVFEKGLGHRHG